MTAGVSREPSCALVRFAMRRGNIITTYRERATDDGVVRERCSFCGGPAIDNVEDLVRALQPVPRSRRLSLSCKDSLHLEDDVLVRLLRGARLAVA